MVKWTQDECKELAWRSFSLRAKRTDLGLLGLVRIAIDEFPPQRRRKLRRTAEIKQVMHYFNELTHYACKAVEAVEGIAFEWATRSFLQDDCQPPVEIETTRVLERLLDAGHALFLFRINDGKHDTALVSVDPESLEYDIIADCVANSIATAAKNLEAIDNQSAA